MKKENIGEGKKLTTYESTSPFEIESDKSHVIKVERFLNEQNKKEKTKEASGCNWYAEASSRPHYQEGEFENVVNMERWKEWKNIKD